jgi:hypothetical protein
MKRFLWGIGVVALILSSVGQVRAGGVEVQVGYADNLRPSPFFPIPWAGGAGVQLFAGSGPAFDSAAVRVINHTGGDITINDLKVDSFGDGAVFQIWGGILGAGYVLHNGNSAIFAQTAEFNFDSSDDEGGNPAALPVVHLTVNGVTSNLTDSAQVLNTEGTDHLGGSGLNESHQWRDIGTTGGQAPEPGSLTLLGLGAFGLFGYAWRRRQLAAA